MSNQNLEVMDLYAELERLKAENAQLKAARLSQAGIRVSNKGAVSVYGINSLPVTLYKEPMLRLLDKAEEIRAFIASHDSELKVKPSGFKSIRDLANEQGLESVAPIMLERQARSTKELQAYSQTQNRSVQTALPGLAATRVQKRR